MNNNAQNGRQPASSTPSRSAPPTDPRIRASAPPSNEICKDFVWGICKKGTQCRFRHELEFESMKKILKFCHNYQNRTGCAGCGYLHTSSEEENLFLTTGQIPKALAERYAAMSAVPVAGAEAGPTASSSMMYSQYMAQPPPPPPPAAAAPAPVGAVPPATLYPTLLAPPPPPPPPTTVTAPAKATAPIYTAPATPSTSTVFSVPQTNNVMPMDFDPSRPPPEAPSVSVNESNMQIQSSMKRLMDLLEAGPSKMRKHDRTDDCGETCEECAKRIRRVEFYRKQIEDLQCQEECNKLVLEAKLKEYENTQDALKSLVSPDMVAIINAVLDEDAEKEQQMINIFMDMLKKKEFEETTLASLTSDDTLLRTVGELTRRRNHSSDLTVLELLRNGNLSERENHNEPKIDTAGLAAFNGQKMDGQPAAAAVASGSLYQPAAAFTPTTQPFASAVPAAPAPAAFVGQVPAAPAFQPYQGVPTAVQRPFYPHPYTSTTNVPGASQLSAPVAMATTYQNGTRAPAPTAPTTTATAPAQYNGQNYTQYVTDKYSPQQYNSPCDYNRYEIAIA